MAFNEKEESKIRENKMWVLEIIAEWSNPLQMERFQQLRCQVRTRPIVVTGEKQSTGKLGNIPVQEFNCNGSIKSNFVLV